MALQTAIQWKPKTKRTMAKSDEAIIQDMKIENYKTNTSIKERKTEKRKEKKKKKPKKERKACQ